jgi:hypothetical protein
MQVHALSPDDREFCAAFEGGRVSSADFNHRSHVRLAYCYLAMEGPASALPRFREALRQFLQLKKIDPAKFSETLTQAWLLAVHHFMCRCGSTSSAEEFLTRNARLMDSKIMLTHYSAKLLFSADARQTFIEPDLAPIPRH